MGDVIVLAKRRRKAPGDMFEVILPLTVFIYAKDSEGAGDQVLLELQKRLHGLQYQVDDWLVRPAEIEHHKA